MLKDVLKAVLRVFAGTIFILALAATIGIPAGKRGPAAAQPGDEPRGWTFRALRGTISHPRMYPDGRRPLLQGEENLDLGRTSANVGADGPNRRSRRTRDPAPRQRVAFPLQATGPATSVGGFRSSIPCPPLGRRCSCLRFGSHLTMRPARLGVRMDSLLLSCRTLSFPIACRFIPAHRLSHRFATPPGSSALPW